MAELSKDIKTIFGAKPLTWDEIVEFYKNHPRPMPMPLYVHPDIASKLRGERPWIDKSNNLKAPQVYG